MKIYGPYTRKDGRQHIVIVEKDGKKRTISYPKFLVEQKLGRQLKPNETIHHVDGNFNNNELSNLIIIDRKDHSTWDVKRVKKVEFICKWCGEKSERRAGDLEHNKVLGKAGPFCSRQCVGKYGQSIQVGKISKMPIQEGCPIEKREYYNQAHL